MKKQQAEERKAKRLEFKEKYGYAEVDGQKLEIANWTSEPSCLFAGRGDHPQRGKWKDGPSEEDIILNLPPDDACSIGSIGKVLFGNPTRCTWRSGKTS